jgi:formylglycine-generating enzyme required for sulfatase activity
VDGRKYPWGDAITREQANYGADCSAETAQDADLGTFTTPVGSFPANGFGLQDMVGNVAEWVSDWAGGSRDAESSAVDPIGPLSGILRVVRGSSWRAGLAALGTSSRASGTQNYSDDTIGFRCTRD